MHTCRYHPFSGGIGERDLRYHRSTNIAAVVEMMVAMSVVPTISAGFNELKFIRMAISVVGINVILDVLSAKQCTHGRTCLIFIRIQLLQLLHRFNPHRCCRIT